MQYSDLNKWAENLQKEVYETWKTKYSFWEFGFKVFYGPIKINPTVMIITHNPGEGVARFLGEDKWRFDEGDFSLPKVNAYIENDNKMAKRMKDFFKDDLKLLEKGVTFPLIFFRSRNIDEWKAIDDIIRTEMEEFCFSKVKQIVQLLKPKMILVHGMETYSRLKDILGNFHEEIRFISNIGDIIRKAKWGRIRMFGMIHPTGSRISNENWNKIKEEFFKELRICQNTNRNLNTDV